MRSQHPSHPPRTRPRSAWGCRPRTQGSPAAIAARCAFVLALSLLSIPGWVEAGGDQLTLEGSIQRALAENPALEGQRRDLQAVELERDAARGLRLPSLSLSGSYTRYSDSTLVHPIHAAGNFPPMDEEIVGVGLDLSLPLYAGGRLVQGEARAEHGVQARAGTVAGTRQQLIYDIVSAYTETLQRSRVAEALEHRIDRLQTEEADLALKIQQGSAAPLERLRVQSQLSQARYDLVAERQGRADASARLATLMGGAEPLPPLADLQTLELPLPGSLDAAIGEARSRHPRLARFRAEQLSAVDELNIARGERLPEIRLQGRLNGQSGGDLALDDEWQLGVSVSMPLLDGGVRSTRVRQAALRRERALLETRSALDSVTLGVREAWGGLATARAQVQAARAGEREAGEALRVETLKFRNGASTVTDLLAAESALWTATANRIRAEYRVVDGQAGVLLATGALEPDLFGKEQP